MTMSLVSKYSKTDPSEESKLAMPTANGHSAPKFSMDLVYDMDVNKVIPSAKKHTQEAETEDAPYCATGASAEDLDKQSVPQAITALQNRLNEANIAGNLYGDSQSQVSILMGALGNAQGLIQSCLSRIGDTGLSAEEAGYIADLNKLHNRILHSLSTVTDPYQREPRATPLTMDRTAGTSQFKL